jgi:DNA-binding MarR family transcriptional regulator
MARGARRNARLRAGWSRARVDSGARGAVGRPVTAPRRAPPTRPASDYRRRGRECAYANLKLMSRAIATLYDEALEPSGLRASELALLWAIVALEPASMSRLAAATLTDVTTLSRTVQGLVRARLCRVREGDDRRVRVVASTALGRRRFDAAMPHWERAQVAAESLVPVARIARLARGVLVAERDRHQGRQAHPAAHGGRQP